MVQDNQPGYSDFRKFRSYFVSIDAPSTRQSSTQNKGEMFPSAVQASQRTEGMLEHHTGIMKK